MKYAVLLIFAFAAGYGSARAFDNAVATQIPVTTGSDRAMKEFLLGQQLSDNLQATKSLEHFDKAIALDSNFATAYLNRANNSLTAKEFFAYLNAAELRKGHASEGEQLMIQAAEAGANGNFHNQRDDLERAVERYPKDARARVVLGTFFFGQQDLGQAIAQYEKAIEISDKFVPAYNILGYAYRQLGQYGKAEKTFKKYTELLPDDPNPYDSFAELLMKIGRFDESIANYQKALSIDPTFTSSEIGLCMNYLYKGEKKDASQAVEKLFAMARNPGERRQAFFIRAVVDVDNGNTEDALKAFDDEFVVGKAINDVAGMAGDLAAKAAILEETGRYDDASKTYDASVEIIEHSNLSSDMKKNTLVIAHYNKAKIAAATGDVEKAKSETEEYWRGVQQKGNSNQIRFTHELRGITALAEKDYGKALTELLQANQQDPYNLYRLALAYEGKGDTVHAKEFFKKAADFYSLPLLNYVFVRNKAAKMILSL